MPDEEGLTTTQAAEALGVPLATLKVWLDKLPIPYVTDSRNRRRLDTSAMGVLATVQELRAADNGYDTIRRKLAQAGIIPGASTADEPEPGGGQAVTSVDRETFLDAVAEAVTGAMRRENEMAEKYARATHRIGQLEAQLEASQQTAAAQLEAERARADLKIGNLEIEVKASRGQAEEAARQMEQLRQELERLRAENSDISSKKRRWWPF